MSAAPPDPPLEQWADRLDATLAPLAHLHRAFVLATTDSTQDAAARLGARPGDIVVAGRQVSGRGRRGRAWVDTGDEGLAVTFIVPADDSPRLAVVFAVGVAEGVERVLGRQVGIKWPNDLVADGRKLAGILIERSGGPARVGVGVNVRQRQWPADLAARAVSLAQLGADVDRLAALESLLPAIDRALGGDDATLAAAWSRRDVLAGTEAVFGVGAREVRGEVVRVDPLRGLAVRVGTEEVWLDAATAVRREAMVEGATGGATGDAGGGA